MFPQTKKFQPKVISINKVYIFSVTLTLVGRIILNVTIL